MTATIETPPPSPIPGDVIPPLVKHWFKTASADLRKLWLYSYTGPAGYTIVGSLDRLAQDKIERSAHYNPPVVPPEAHYLAYTNGRHIMDFAATEIRASLSLNPQPQSIN